MNPKFFVGIAVAGLAAVIGVIAFIEAILYLTKNPEDFHSEYVENEKHWF